MKRILHIVIGCLAALLLVSSCSTTRRLPPGEVRYAGLKGIDVVVDSGQRKVPSDIRDQLADAAEVQQEGPLLLRWPAPIGLWVYNNWPDSAGGLRGWLYDKLAIEPTTITDVRPEVRTQMMERIMDRNGYFRAVASYDLVSGSNKRKARILYTVDAGPAFPIDTLELLPPTTPLNRAIDSLALRQKYFATPGQRYSTDSLSDARTRIANSLRNRGYYFFRPEYIEYLADSVANPGHIQLRMALASNIPDEATQRYTTGKVRVHLNRRYGHNAVVDTIPLERATVYLQQPSRFRKSIIPESVTFRPGRTFSVRQMNQTQTYLSRLGIFSAIDIAVTPDSLASKPTLDVDITCTFDTPLEASIEVNATSKSNSYIGPGVTLGVTNRNIFGGGEQFGLQLTGSYEWQTGKGEHRSLFNSYEVGLTASLAFPRLLAPNFIPRRHRQLNWTRVTLNADLLNRPHFFEMAQFNTGISYDWRATRHVQNTLTLFKLTYTKLMHTTAAFDSIMANNQAVALSFKSQFIPEMSFGYAYDRAFGPDNTLNWQFNIKEAGNVFWGIYQLCGVKGEKRLFGTPFSQFIKGSTQLVWGTRILPGDNWLFTRVAVGAAHAYGNSSQVPYAEQFYVGGANSVRAFTVRSIGPGSYRAPAGKPEEYFDQTGTFKFEANLEYRFPIWGMLHGAAFIDTGNVWLLRDDPLRPGGTLRASSFLKDLALGTGVGLRFDISMLVIRGDLGIGIHAPYDTGRRGYYNMKNFGSSLAFHLAIGYPF